MIIRVTLNDAKESCGLGDAAKASPGLWHPRGAAPGCSEQCQEGSAAPGAPGFQQSLGVPRASPLEGVTPDCSSPTRGLLFRPSLPITSPTAPRSFKQLPLLL